LATLKGENDYGSTKNNFLKHANLKKVFAKTLTFITFVT